MLAVLRQRNNEVDWALLETVWPGKTIRLDTAPGSEAG